MALVRVPKSRYWHYQTKINGKTWRRSTGQTNRKLAVREVPRLKAIAEKLRKRPGRCSMLSDAIPREVDRVESDVGRSRAARVRVYLINFARFTGDVPLDRIGVDLLERHQRHRLAVAATDTVNHEICAVIAMLKRHGFQVAKPSPKAGRRTEQRAFTADELPRFFAVCPDRLRPLYLTMLATGARQAELVPSPRSNHKPLLKAEVNLDARQIVIRSAKRRQGQPAAPRVLPIPDALVPILADQIAATDGPYVFHLLANSDRDFNAILRRAGIP